MGFWTSLHREASFKELPAHPVADGMLLSTELKQMMKHIIWQLHFLERQPEIIRKSKANASPGGQSKGPKACRMHEPPTGAAIHGQLRCHCCKRLCTASVLANVPAAGVAAREPESVNTELPFRTELRRMDRRPRIVLHGCKCRCR
jgi:hypothetical protein